MSMITKNAMSAVLIAVVVAATVTARASDSKDKKPKHDESAAGHSHEMSEIHGGRVTMTPNHHFEVLFTANEARVYLYNKAQKPIEPGEKVSATLILTSRDGGELALEMKRLRPDAEKGRASGYLAVAHDFSGVEENQMKAMVRAVGLTEEPIEFKTSVVVSEAASYACPMNCVAPAADPMACPKCGMRMVRQEGKKEDKGHDHSSHGHAHDGHH